VRQGTLVESSCGFGQAAGPKGFAEFQAAAGPDNDHFAAQHERRTKIEQRRQTRRLCLDTCHFVQNIVYLHVFSIIPSALGSVPTITPQQSSTP